MFHPSQPLYGARHIYSWVSLQVCNVQGSMSFMDYFGENPASILIPLSKLHLSRLSWNWRKRSSIKITERTYEEGTEAFHTRRKSSHLEAASCGQSTRLGAV